MITAYQASSQARVDAAMHTLFTAPSPELAREWSECLHRNWLHAIVDADARHETR